MISTCDKLGSVLGTDADVRTVDKDVNAGVWQSEGPEPVVSRRPMSL